MDTVIIGAGLSGIAAAHALKRSGIDRFLVFERADGVGGVWRANHYPGAACDVPSYLYSYSWAQRRDWTRSCAAQSELQDYLEDLVTEHGLEPHLRFGAEVVAARWSEEDGTWHLVLDDGETLQARQIVLATGQLSRPAWPSIPGREDFGGESFHSAEWDHSVPLDGRRVAVVGTGASAVQFVPHVARTAGTLTVFQRTAPYLMPRANPRYPKVAVEAVRRIPGLQWLRRSGAQLVMDVFMRGLTNGRLIGWCLRSVSLTFMRVQVRDPELRAKITPDYPFGCKRILFGSAYLPALGRPNVDVVTASIEAIEKDGIRCADGTRHQVDVMIFGTGFQAGTFVAPMRIAGRTQELQQAWQQAPRAYLGMTVPGFPNAFVMYGPNTNLSVGSVITMLEAQAGYIAQAIDFLRRHDAESIDVRGSVADSWDTDVQQQFEGTVWTQCSSWYRQGGTGRIVGNWPGYVRAYQRAVARFNPADYLRTEHPQHAGEEVRPASVVLDSARASDL